MKDKIKKEWKTILNANKKYIIIQDGDEYCIWKDLIDCGLIDKKVIENMEDQ